MLRCSIYDRNLAKSLRNIFMRHAHLFDGIGGDFQPELVAKCRTIRDFDDAITRVSFGWPSVDAYYAGSGSDQVSACCSMRMSASKGPQHVACYQPVQAVQCRRMCGHAHADMS